MAAGPEVGRRGAAGLPEQVQVAGLCRVGMAVAVLLAGLSVRTLALWDPRPVSVSDLGTGLLPADLGRPRARAAEHRLQELRPELRVYAHHGHRPMPLGDLTVAVGSVAEPDVAARCLAADHALLPVAPGVAGSAVGPWTGPGVPGCLLCRAAETDRGGDVDPLEAQRAAVLTVDAILDRRAEPGSRSSPVRSVLRTVPGEHTVRRGAVSPRPGCACDRPEPPEEWDTEGGWAVQGVGEPGWPLASAPWSSSRMSGP